MVLLYMVTWIPSIYPSHVSIYTSTMDPSWVMSVPEIRPPCENVDVVHPPKGRCHALAKPVKIIQFFAHDWRTEMALDPTILARWLAVHIQQHGHMTSVSCFSVPAFKQKNTALQKKRHALHTLIYFLCKHIFYRHR